MGMRVWFKKLTYLVLIEVLGVCLYSFGYYYSRRVRRWHVQQSSIPSFTLSNLVFY